LTGDEIASIKDLVLDPSNRHMPLGTLARHAQRIGKVFASAATWARLVRERGWRRPRQRIHPQKPTVGIRATKPSELWHIDVSIIKLIDGTKAYIHAVIDNYSRKILAWTIGARLDPLATCAVLLEAGKHLCAGADTPTVMADSGVENVNAAVNATLVDSGLRRVLAQVDVNESNSMIEAFWRSLKHNWLYLNSLDSIERLRSLVDFFVQAHNSQMPHHAFHVLVAVFPLSFPQGCICTLQRLEEQAIYKKAADGAVAWSVSSSSGTARVSRSRRLRA
jgi:transposase InsO family protein